MKKTTEKPPEEEKQPRRRVKKVKGHAAHHGGAWKVAYADFVTAMMALFLVLWLVSQADVKVKQAIASYFRSPGVFDTMNGGILPNAKKVSKEPTSLTSKDEEQTLFSVSESLKKKFDSKPEFSKLKDQIQIKLTEEGIKIEILDKAERVSFSVGGSELSEEAKLILAEIAKAICDLPNPLIIGGHTDSRVYQSEKGYTNWELSTDRANSARRYLETQCVTPEQIRRIIGYGASQPLLPQDPYNPANRRISLTIVRNILPDSVNQSDSENQVPESGLSPEDLRNQLKEIKPSVEKQPIAKEPTAKKLKEPSEKINETPVETTVEESVKPLIENKPTVKSELKVEPKTETKSTVKSAEVKEAERKLVKDGAVVVGEPDLVPKKPKN